MDLKYIVKDIKKPRYRNNTLICLCKWHLKNIHKNIFFVKSMIKQIKTKLENLKNHFTEISI